MSDHWYAHRNTVTLSTVHRVQQGLRDMAGFRTQYTRLNSNSDDPEEDLPPQGFDIGARGFEEIEKGNLLKNVRYVNAGKINDC